MHGLFLRLTHTGSTPTSVYVADVEAVPATVPSRKPGPVYVSPNASVDLVFTSSVALSFERGNIQQFVVNGLLTTSFVFGDEWSEAMLHTLRQPFITSAGNTIIETLWLPYPVRVWGVQAYATTPGVTAGTYTLQVTADGNDLLDPVTVDLTALVAVTVTDCPLTSTTADLELAADTPIEITVASDNGDLVGDGLVIQILYGLR